MHMRKYYVCDVIGDGSQLNPYRPKIADLGVNFVAAFNAPAKNWAICRVSSANHDQLEVAGVDSMPDFPLDSKMNSMGQAAKNAMNAKLTARGITQPTNPDAYRDVIKAIGLLVDLNFSEDNFDVAEPTV